jgi:TonB family protein
MRALLRLMPLLCTVVVVLAPVPSFAMGCPLAVSAFAMVGRTGDYAVYGIEVSSPTGRSLPAIVEVATAAAAVRKQLMLPGAGGQKTFWALFSSSRNDLVTARVRALTPLGAQTEEACTSSTSTLQPPIDPSTVTFAPGTLPKGDRLTLASASGPSQPAFVHRTEPTYPPEAVRAGIGGHVDVEVDVSALGTASNEVVANSSGYPPLDEAAVAATTASTYREPETAARPAPTQYLVPYTFTLGLGRTTIADTACRVRITRGWLIGLNRVAGDNLYEIGLQSARSDVTSVDITLEKGDALPPTTFGDLRWRRRADGTFETAVYALVGGGLVGAVRLESVDLSKSPSLNCAPYTIVTWDHTAGALEAGTMPTQPPVATSPNSVQVVLPAVFVHRAWPQYPASATSGYLSGIVTVVVDVDASGKASSASVYRSSGAQSLDAAAMTAALASSYWRPGTPAKYVSSYVFRTTPSIEGNQP